MEYPVCTVNTDMANKIILKKFIWHFLNATLTFKLIKKIKKP